MSWGRNYSYMWPEEERVPHRVTTSSAEILQIGIAYAVLTFDLVLIFGNVGAYDGFDTSYITPGLILVCAIAAFTGFVAHEMAHKISAQRRGFWAEFRLSAVGLLVSVVTAALGFLFAAPGATMIGGMDESDREDWGRTALAGPLSNVAFAGVFYVGSIGLFLADSPWYGWLLVLAFVNAWFAAFNLIPIGPLDGRKVLRWSTGLWVAVFVAVAVFTAAMAVALYLYGDPLFV
jgi:Zn-dependent protease